MVPTIGTPASANALVADSLKEYFETLARTPAEMASSAQCAGPVSGSSLALISQSTSSSGRFAPPAGSVMPPALLIAATAAWAPVRISGWAATPSTGFMTESLIGAPDGNGFVLV